MSVAINIHEEVSMAQAQINDYDRTMWALGWYLKRERTSGRFKEHSLSAFGRAIGMSHSGYNKLEAGESPNLKAWFAIMEHIGKRFSRVLLMAEAIATELELEEDLRGRPLEEHERERVASRLFDTFQNL